MCGIAAIASPDPRVREHIGAMCDQQHERGPDHRGIREHHSVAMGHTRLALLDLSSTGDQPMDSASWSIVYNGEVYNHQDLRLHGQFYHSGSDTESVLKFIQVVGVRETLKRMRGMWAFAAWNSQEQKLYVATDPFGIKPLYVHVDETAGTFACASSSAALLQLKPKWKVSTSGLAAFFHLGGSRGVWQGIQRLDGGILGIWDARAHTWSTERWYQPAFNPHAKEEITDLLESAILGAATADVPVGLFFSGGIDSTVCAEIMARGQQLQTANCKLPTANSQLPTPNCQLSAFHLNSPELPYAQLAARRLNLDLHVVPDDATKVITAYTDIAKKTGEPTMAGFIPWITSQYAAQHVKAAISANGADELFFGYDRIGQDQPAQDAHLFRDPQHWLPRNWPKPAWQVPTLPAGNWPKCAPSRWRELMLYVQHDLNPTLDAASMCHSLEMRVPYLDHKLVEAALSLPAAWHGRKAFLKARLLKAGFDHDFVERTKLGFSMNAKNPNLEAWKNAALKQARTTLGIEVKRTASGRDAKYIGACAAGWLAWWNTWKHKMA